MSAVRPVPRLNSSTRPRERTSEQALSGFQFWLYSPSLWMPWDGSSLPEMMSSSDPSSRNRELYILMGGFLFVTLGIGAVGYRYYAHQKAGIEAEVHNQLAAIAELKVRQVVAWRRERLADATIIAATEIMPAVQMVLNEQANATVRASVLAWLETIRKAGGYANAILVNSAGRTCLLSGQAEERAQDHYAALTKQVLDTGGVIFSDLHYDEGLQAPHLGLSVPLRFTRNGPFAGALLLGINPNDFLYPLMQSWPTPSGSAETLLVRREGNEVVYLNELRHRKGTALRLRFPLTNKQLPAVRAVLGLEGVADGFDYRGVRVLAAVRRVPGSTWALVAKVDVDEVYAPIHEQALWFGLVVCALLLATGAGVGFAGRHMRARFYQQKYEAELERRALLGHYAFLSRFANDIMLLMNESGRVVEANDRALASYGYPRDELIGMPLRELRDPETLEAFDKQWQALDKEESLVFETRHRRKDGSTFPVEVSARRMAVEGMVFRQSIIRDITERKHSDQERAKLQQQLQQAQKMESIGRLAGGVAHDFNNLLTVINGYADLLMSQVAQADPLRASIVEIGKAGERAASLTRQLLAFSRQQIIEPKVIDLNEVIRDTSKLLGRLVGEDIEVVTILAPSLGRVLADRGQIHQVLMNLAVNARDAMRDGGKLLIGTEHVEFDDEYVAAHAGTKAGPYVLLTVTDTGIGMDAETQQHAFEPFFTTKPQGEGTGLGLSTVYGIVKQSQGWIGVYSEPGKGTTFKIYLPRVSDVMEVRPATPVGMEALQGTETILVVEDQPEVRKLAVQVLSRHGYRMLEAANGKEALLLCGPAFPDPIHLMITDVVMPGMTGRVLATQVAPLRPAMRVLYMSGYTAQVLDHQGVLDPDVAYIAKPFTPTALLIKVRELLNDAAGEVDHRL